ncbi:hypothetical protein RclHR1_28890002 [Rhizophagus clarus]|uniref:Uncharacterized protein n=1 Tax=Rhizophagus clarus TaxID=94130 RepID=A0A2Z6R3U2_9GLOM|nr:hypothetical protein RclHR1_28890002 [Rhizophagus clarus]
MLQTNNYDVSEEFLNNLRDNFSIFLLKNIEQEKRGLQKMWPRTSSWDIQKNVPTCLRGEFGYSAEEQLELSKYWDVCPVLISYIQSLTNFILERALLHSWQILDKASKLRQVENQDTPIIDSNANAQMDIEISNSEAN